MHNVQEARVASRLRFAVADLMDPVRQVPNDNLRVDGLQPCPHRRAHVFDAQDLGLPADMAALIPEETAPLDAVTSLLRSSRVFDRGFYLAQLSDALGDDEDPELHFLTRGWRDGFAPNFYIEPSFYLAQAGIGEAGALNPLLHYLYIGEPAGLRPSAHFEPEWYRRHYGLIGQSPLCHYLRHLDAHRYSPNPDFDVEFYVKTYADVREDCGDPFYHFVLYGRHEGRLPHAIEGAAAAQAGGRDLEAEVRTILDSNLFDAAWYRTTSGQAATNVADLALHYLTAPAPERSNPNPLFDAAFYAGRHAKDLQGVDPFVHYLREGWRVGFDPHPLFDVRFYLESHADIREVGCEPLWHYLNFGWREGRRPCEEFDTAYYLAANPDLSALDIDPLTHYLEHGAAEGRNPSSGFDTAWYARRVLKGEAVNPLVHFRLSGADQDVFIRTIALRKTHEMSRREFELWRRWFDECECPRGRRAGVVRIDGEGLRAAIAASRDQAASESGRRALLVCEPSDTVDDGLLPHLAHLMGRADLGVFDFVRGHDDAWFPVLLPGANAVHHEAVDASCSRFAISSRLLACLDLDTRATAYDVLKAALAHLRATRRLDLFAHMAMPLLRAESLSTAVQAERRHLAFEAHAGARGVASSREPTVSVVICSKDRCRLLSQLLAALTALPISFVRDIVVVTNAAADSFAARVQAHHGGDSRIVILRHDGPYNFSQQSNAGAARCSGDLLLFLNDDIVPIVPHWLEALRAPFARAEVGIAGPLLFYPDERVQHAGLYLGYRGIAGHALRGARLPDEDYMFMGSAPRNVSAVTGAALLTRRDLFETLNGFDRQLGTYLQDVDYCLRVRNSDREIVFEPRSFLFHMESVSMRETPEAPVFGDRRPLEHRHFVRKWGHALADDPFHNPNLGLEDERLRTIVRGAA